MLIPNESDSRDILLCAYLPTHNYNALKQSLGPGGNGFSFNQLIQMALSPELNDKNIPASDINNIVKLKSGMPFSVDGRVIVESMSQEQLRLESAARIFVEGSPGSGKTSTAISIMRTAYEMAQTDAPINIVYIAPNPSLLAIMKSIWQFDVVPHLPKEQNVTATFMCSSTPLTGQRAITNDEFAKWVDNFFKSIVQQEKSHGRGKKSKGRRGQSKIRQRPRLAIEPTVLRTLLIKYYHREGVDRLFDQLERVVTNKEIQCDLDEADCSYNAQGQALLNFCVAYYTSDDPIQSWTKFWSEIDEMMLKFMNKLKVSDHGLMIHALAGDLLDEKERNRIIREVVSATKDKKDVLSFLSAFNSIRKKNLSVISDEMCETQSDDKRQQFETWLRRLGTKKLASNWRNYAEPEKQSNNGHRPRSPSAAG